MKFKREVKKVIKDVAKLEIKPDDILMITLGQLPQKFMGLAAKAIITDIRRAGIPNRCLFLVPPATIETLNETQMEAAGWVRKEAATANNVATTQGGEYAGPRN